MSGLVSVGLATCVSKLAYRRVMVDTDGFDDRKVVAVSCSGLVKTGVARGRRVEKALALVAKEKGVALTHDVSGRLSIMISCFSTLLKYM